MNITREQAARFQDFINGMIPDDHPLARATFHYRQAFAVRQAAERQVEAARKALAEAEANLHRRVGYEAGIQDLIIAQLETKEGT